MLARNSLLARLAASAASLAAQHRLLRRLPLRHVPEHPLRADHLALEVVHGRLEHLHVDRLAVGLLMPLDVFEHASGPHDPLVVLPILLGQFRGEEVEIGLADDFPRRLPSVSQNSLLANVKRPARSLRKMFNGRLSTRE